MCGSIQDAAIRMRPSSITMTTDRPRMALSELNGKNADVDLRQEMVQFAAQRLMGLDVGAMCGTGYGKPGPAS